MRRLFSLGLLAALSCAPKRTLSPPELVLTPISAPAEPAPKPTRPRVVVTIVVDQLAAWIADERWPDLPKSGGFARLLREGTRVRDMRYAHSVTDTAPGHAALYTGAVPRISGIVSNEVPGDDGKPVSVLRDTTATTVTPAGLNGPGSSAENLRVETVADRLRGADPDAYIVSVSLKDRGAIFAGGRKPSVALWYFPRGPSFVTSTAFADDLPPWAKRLARNPLALADAKWDLLDAPWVKAHARAGDAQEGEGNLGGLGTTFPHPLASADDPGLAFRATPFGDAAIFALAEAALGDPRAAQQRTLLALSLSSNDYIGHTFGPDSWEQWDELLRLDGALGGFLRALDIKFGTSGYAVVLSADHGVAPMPEIATQSWCGPKAADHWGRTCGGGRILPGALETELKAVSANAIGKGEWVRAVVDPYVYLTSSARALPQATRTKLDRALTAALMRHREVAEVFDVRTLPGTCPGEENESTPALVCRSYMPGSGGDFYVVPRPGSFFDPNIVIGKGTSHGTPYLYDRSVPLIVRAPDRVPAGVIVTEPTSFGAFAHTAAALLDIDAPAAARLAPDLTQPRPRSSR